MLEVLLLRYSRDTAVDTVVAQRALVAFGQPLIQHRLYVCQLYVKVYRAAELYLYPVVVIQLYIRAVGDVDLFDIFHAEAVHAVEKVAEYLGLLRVG